MIWYKNKPNAAKYCIEIAVFTHDWSNYNTLLRIDFKLMELRAIDC